MKKQSTCLLLLMLATQRVSAQSPWPQNKAGVYAQIAYHFIPEYKDLFGPTGDAIPLSPKVYESALQVYGEYGLSDLTTISTTIPIRIQRASTPITRISTLSVGNISLAARQAIFTGNIRLTGSLRVDFPVPDFDQSFRNGFNAFTVEPMVSTGMGLGDIYWYAYGGFGVRSRQYGNFANLGAEAGVKVRKWWLIGFTEWLNPLGKKSNELPPDYYRSGLFLDHQGWWSIGCKFIYQPNRFWGLTSSFAGAGWGQYVPKSPGIGFGIFFKWE